MRMEISPIVSIFSLVSYTDYFKSHNHESLFTEICIIKDVGYLRVDASTGIFITGVFLKMEHVVFLKATIIESDFEILSSVRDSPEVLGSDFEIVMLFTHIV